MAAAVIAPILVPNRMTKMSLELKQGQSRLFHRLPSGLAMEVISQPAHGDGPKAHPPLVFVHGSFHAAWCWAEHWLPFFSTAGFDCYALSLLGQGESDIPSGSVAGTIETHTTDIADFIQREVNSPPVLIGHSFGGLIVQSYISNTSSPMLHQSDFPEKNSLYPHLAGAVLVCSVPPSGNSGMVWRYLLKKPVAAIKVTLSLAAKAFTSSLPLCKETFFSTAIDDKLVLRYQKLMKDSTKVPLFDLRKLNASLPLSSVAKGSLPILVMGASDDFIVDTEGLQETSRFYGVEAVCVEGVAHDMMIDLGWEKGAERILTWLQNLHSANT